ncbi:hypothetical protein [Kangiella sp. TOML190]|uniref:hypothetical protein n=1 Tax=Kangiella sp. TOML190 TaxID=2931351 RepID=UPI00203F96DC|nr:hypothetical protein [Kangiella sp. TOML190]
MKISKVVLLTVSFGMASFGLNSVIADAAAKNQLAKELMSLNDPKEATVAGFKLGMDPFI